MGTHAATPGTAAPDRHRLAGLALRNGVLVIGPTHWAATVRLPDGSMATESRPRPTVGAGIDRFPALRGPVRLTEMVLVLPALKRALPQASFSFESRQLIATSLAGGVVNKLLRTRFRSALGTELVGSAMSLAMLMVSLRGGELAQYHGAEHKAIGGYEQDIPARLAPKEHPRCGTHLAVPMVIGNALALELTRRAFPNHRNFAKVAGFGLGLASSTELGRAMATRRDSAWSRGLARVGTQLQSSASTREPTPAQLEVAESALAALLAAEAHTAAA